LRAVKAPQTEIAEAKRLYDEQRQSGLATPAAVSAPEASPSPAPEPVSEKPGKALRPWIEVALPHPDVLANRFKESEFAADLFAVDSGNAEGDYATPRGFFGITFLTEGLKRVLVSALQRLSGQGGDPVIGLQTAFGGGKTHTLLAVYHLARHLKEGGNPADLPGLGTVIEGFANVSWKTPQLASFVGSSKGTDVSLTLNDGPRLRTLWGYIAWRIAGEAGLKLVAEAEAARTNPGSELMVEVFRLAGPSVILLDELVMFARQLDDIRFEAFLSFIQSLTEAAKMVPGVLIIGSLPESDAEAGGARGREALLRLEKVFGRVQSPWLPASGNETYEIVRRRLFQALDPEGERARDETVKAFADLYRRNPAEFPPEAREARYTELLCLSYPIHPELFDRLAKDWSSLEKFQRTRDVLRFMANVVGVLWQAQARDPLILPARVPVAHERVRASALYPLDPAFTAVVDREVDGDGSLPARMEANPTRRISQARAATRAARAVFLCSAPLVGQPNAGLTRQGLRLACAEPGDQPAIFGEALTELSERATYLYEEAGRYWFSTQPTLNRLAEDVRFYGQWMRDEAERRIGHLYPKARLPDGSDPTVIAWLWARTVRSPDPRAKGAMVPLVSSFLLSTKEGKKAWVEPVIDPAAPDGWRFDVRTGMLAKEDEKRLSAGTKPARATFSCALTGANISGAYIDDEAQAGRMSARLMAVVAEGMRSRIYLSPAAAHEHAAAEAANFVAKHGDEMDLPRQECRGTFASNAQGRRYCFNTFADYFTRRQLVTLTTFSDLIGLARMKVLTDARAAGLPDDPTSLHAGGSGAAAYADAVATYFGFVLSKIAQTLNSLVRWFPTGEKA
jgi:hypothetical protein